MDLNNIYNEERIQAENLMEGLYRHEPDGSYTLHAGYDYLPKDDLMCHEFWKRWREKMNGIREKVNAGELSPLFYYQEKNFLDARTFAKFLGVSYWRYRSHIKPKGFAQLKQEMLQQYASALEISVDDLLMMK
jgi:hypothetical protein